MTRQLFKVLGAASLVAVLAALSIPAQAADLSCDVPFGFVVNGKALPAGNYQLSTQHSSLLVRGVRDGAVVLTIALKSRKATDAKLVFHKYGEQYILREAWTGGSGGREVPQSSLERELMERVRRTEATDLFERVTVPAL